MAHQSEAATATNSDFTGRTLDNISSVRQLENTIQLDPYFSYCLYIHFNAQENIYFILLSFAAKQTNEIPFSHVLIITVYFLYILIGVFKPAFGIMDRKLRSLWTHGWAKKNKKRKKSVT